MTGSYSAPPSLGKGQRRSSQGLIRFGEGTDEDKCQSLRPPPVIISSIASREDRGNTGAEAGSAR